MRRAWLTCLIGLLLVACSGGSSGGGQGGGAQPSPAGESPQAVDDGEAVAWTAHWQPGLQDYAGAVAQLATLVKPSSQSDSLSILTAATQVQAANDNLDRAIKSAGPPPASIQAQVDEAVANLRAEPASLDLLMEACSQQGQGCIDAETAWTELSTDILNAFAEIPGTTNKG